MSNRLFTPDNDRSKHNSKAIARSILNDLPDDCTLEDIMLELYIRASIVESRQQIAAGNGLTLDEAKRELDSWLKSFSPESSTHS